MQVRPLESPDRRKLLPTCSSSRDPLGEKDHYSVTKGQVEHGHSMDVGILTRYSNRSDLLHELGEATRRLERASQDEQLSVRSVRSPKRQGRALTERLSEAGQRKIILSCDENGELQRVVAERHHISVRSVRRLLRQQQIRT